MRIRRGFGFEILLRGLDISVGDRWALRRVALHVTRGPLRTRPIKCGENAHVNERNDRPHVPFRDSTFLFFFFDADVSSTEHKFECDENMSKYECG